MTLFADILTVVILIALIYALVGIKKARDEGHEVRENLSEFRFEMVAVQNQATRVMDDFDAFREIIESAKSELSPVLGLFKEKPEQFVSWFRSVNWEKVQVQWAQFDEWREENWVQYWKLVQTLFTKLDRFVANGSLDIIESKFGIGPEDDPYAATEGTPIPIQ